MANIVLPFVTTYDDKGAKAATGSLAALAKSWLGATASVTVVVDQLGKAVRAAAEDEEAQKQLAIAVQNSTDASSAQIAEIEKTIGQMQFQKAVSDGELRPALASLVRATEDVTKAQELLSLALDISAGTGRDLQSVSIALARAQTGNITALTRLGIPLDAAAVKSKDLAAIQADLQDRFKGAADAAANSAQGGMKQLQIALDETYETVGNALLPVLNDYVTVLGDVAKKTLESSDNSKGFGNRLFDMLKVLNPVARIIDTVNGFVGDYADGLRQAEVESNRLNQVTSRVTKPTKEYTTAVEENTSKTKANTDAKKKAQEAAKKYADTLRERVKTALEATNDSVDKAQQAFDDYSQSLSDSIRGFVSLADAVKTQKDAEDGLADSYKQRAKAYEDLKALDPVEQAEQYADALKKVKEAEDAVTSAQNVRTKSDYTKVFADQISKAKSFSENLQHLIAQGLGAEGLAQLLNLGPVVGNEVTADMLYGTKALTVAGLNQSLSTLSASGTQLGMAGANAFFGGALATAKGNQSQVNQYQITVNAGLVSNPAQVGRDIIEAIKQAERVSGVVFQPA